VGFNQIWAGQLSNPLKALTPKCSGREGNDRSVAVTADSAAIAGPGCGEKSVISLQSGVVTDRLPSDAHTLRIAGRYVAYLHGAQDFTTSIEVYDTVEDRSAYTVTDLTGKPYALSIQADGKVLFAWSVTDVPGNQAIGWSSSDDPKTHKLVEGPQIYLGRIAGDRAVVMSRPRNRATSAGTLRLYPLDGGGGKLLATPVVTDNFRERSTSTESTSAIQVEHVDPLS
jgi:hypothetical protein